jgi:hypothetical protein
MRRWCAYTVLTVAAVAMVTGCGSSAAEARRTTSPTSRPSTVTTGNDRTVTKQMRGVGFRTEIPRGWLVGHHAEGGVDIYQVIPSAGATAADGSFVVKRLPFTAIPTTALPGVDLTHDDMVDLLPKVAPAGAEDTNIAITVQPHDLVIASEAAASVTTTFDEDGVHLTRQSTLVRHGRQFFEFDVVSSPATFLNRLALFEQSEDRVLWQ